MGEIKIVVDGYKCERCKHEWIPRSKKKLNPIICPSCKSPYWNIPKKMRKSKAEVKK
jgi:DNA-directed RNA polymerase subunit RPC12/RpoP